MLGPELCEFLPSHISRIAHPPSIVRSILQSAMKITDKNHPKVTAQNTVCSRKDNNLEMLKGILWF